MVLELFTTMGLSVRHHSGGRRKAGLVRMVIEV